MKSSTSKHKLPLWQFMIPLAVQVAIVLSIPAKNALTIINGTTIYLQTAPVDPYDVLRGRYVTLNYDISRRDRLKALPGWSDTWSRSATEIYVVLAPPPDPQSRDPWQPVFVSNAYPKRLEPGQQIIKGRWQSWRLDIGLGAYYIPEDIGDRLEKDLREHPEDTRVEVKVDQYGQATLMKLWVEDRRY